MSQPNTFELSGKFRSRTEWMILFFIAFVGTAISVAAYHIDITMEALRNQISFEKAANRRLSLLRENVEYFESTFGSLQNLYYASTEVTRKDFHDYAIRMMKQNPGILALEWVPRITNKSLSKFVDDARKDGFPDFEVKEKDSQGKLVQRSAQAEYFPVYYLEPLKGNETAFGFDAASEPTRRAILERSRDTGKIVATQQIQLVQQINSESGFVIFAPVYVKGTPIDTVMERRKNLEGFLVGVFRTEDFSPGVFKDRNLRT